ncbi:hypothetical protein Anas_14164 [Armadillidium nasatum]|uniref:Uncharacterized protein n=1 Tax=Armadillidium nasatum TaxID=96803 RepID=A0A5N5TBZ6_9CRUS|nr:hypothetical protein Anas_14164 [Armadillidium nasatum]
MIFRKADSHKYAVSSDVGLEAEETKIKITTEVKESKTELPSSNASIKNHNIINTKDDKPTEDLQRKKLQNATDRQEKEQQKPIPFKEKMSDESINAKETKQSPIKSSSEEGFNTRSESILLISLGGGEDEILISQMAWLFYRHQKRVTLLLYGEHHREENLPEFVKIITIPIGDDDPIRTQDNNYIGLTPEDSSRGEWVSGQILWSRVAACKGLINKESEIIKLNPDVIISPLFLHDVCVLSLSFRLKIPVVGVLTSRVGAWWTWAQLGVLPSLSTASVPLTSLGNRGIFSRASNLASHYNYMSSLRQQWQVKAVNALAPMDVPSLAELYGTVSRLVLSWDPLVDPSVIPVPTAVPIGGFASILSDEDDQISFIFINLHYFYKYY